MKEKDGEWKLYKVKEIDAPPAATTAAAIVPKLYKVEKIYKVPDKNAYKKGKKIKVKWSYHIEPK